MTYNKDLTLIKNHLRIAETEEDYDDALTEALEEAFEDFKIFLREMGVDETNLPPDDETDPDDELLKKIEARGGAGFYTEDSWEQTKQFGDREKPEDRPWNTHLATYFRMRKSLYTARFGVGVKSSISFKRGFSLDVDEPTEDEDI